MLYDADCGFCTRSVRLLVAAGVTAVCAPLQGVDLAELGVDAGRAVRELPAVLGDGRVAFIVDVSALIAMAKGLPVCGLLPPG